MSVVLKELTKPAITREQLREYADASSDWNKIHIDEEAARALGFPSVIAHGMLSAAFVADFIRAHFPDDRYFVKRLRTKFRKITFPADVLTCGGEVRDMEKDPIEVTLWVKNQQGEITVDGEAEVLRRESNP